MSIDLNALKEKLQTIFEAANTATAARDLSSGLVDRVKQVLKVNPGKIPIQPSFYPCVTTFIEGKEIELKSIGRDQLSVKREAHVNLAIVGVTFNSTFADPNVDQADEDCENLMENIEQILRADPTLGGTVTWQYPTGVTYHTIVPKERTMLRAGIINIRTKIFY